MLEGLELGYSDQQALVAAKRLAALRASRAQSLNQPAGAGLAALRRQPAWQQAQARLQEYQVA